jgi:hypothetical protein
MARGATPTAPTAATQTPLTPEPAAALARCVGDVERFLDERFTVAPHAWTGGGFDDLLSLADVDRALTGAGLRRPAVRVVRDGEVLDPATWTRPARTGNARIDDLVHPGRLLGLYAEGATVVLQSLQRWWPPVTAFCQDLEEVLGHPVQANAYLTPPGAAGLAPHHDTHDVFVLQLHGSKSWTVRAPVIAAPLPRHRADHDRAGRQPVLLETDLAAGDCLYLPRGFVHAARAQTDASLHLTIGVLAPTVHDLVRRLVEATADDPAFRRNLPIGYATNPEVAERSLKDAVGELVRWLDGLDHTATAAALRPRVAGSRSAPMDGHLLELVGLDAIGDGTLVRRRSRTPHRTSVVDGRLRVSAGDRTLALPAALEEALGRVLDGGVHRVGSLGDLLDGASRAVLVRRLVREGVLRVVTDEAG